jgi:hypothetical protein
MRIKIDKADATFSKYMRAKYPACQVCGKPSSQCHHFKGRRFQSVRFDENNIWVVCFGCHRKFEEDADFAVSMQRKRLGAGYDAFIVNANSVMKRSEIDKKEIAKYFTEKLKEVSL